MSYENAQKAAQNAGFLLSILSREYSIEFEKNIVMTQSVPAGIEIMSGNTVELVVSLGIQEIKVADVQFKTETEARTILGDQGLKVNASYENSETVASGLVISQSPAEQTSVDPGAVVSIVVSSGGESFTMPNVVGMDESSARTILSGKGLSVSVNYEKSGTVAEGNVIRQSLAANTSTNRGNLIILTVSSGQDLVSVSSVFGQTESAAKNTLSAQGFNVSVSEAFSDTIIKGNIISQSPAAGSSQQKGAMIALTVSKGPEPISIPSVVGITRSVAENTLKNLGFIIGASEVFSETIPKGSVISQSLSAGGTGKRGDTITIVVSKGKEQVAVPNVVGQNKTNAANTLKNIGFNADYREAYDDKTAKDLVISQNPSAGASIGKGDMVTLTISLGKAPNPPKNLYLDQTSLSLTEGGTAQIKATIEPENADDKTIKWKSSNENVATVSSSGFVTARGNGSATITASTNTGNISKTCSVSVAQKQATSI
jgi:serine/threonine-protein kinase